MTARVLVAALAAAAAAAIPASAQAGTYTVESCHAADGAALDGRAWQPSARGRGRTIGKATEKGCLAANGAMRATFPGRRGATRRDRVGLTFRAPNGTHLQTVTLERELSADGQFGHEVIAVLPAGTLRRVDSCAGGACAAKNGAATISLPAQTRAVRVQLTCLAARCAKANGAAMALKRAAVVVVDNRKPRLFSLRGPLVGRGLQIGSRAVRLRATDSGGGLKQVQLEVDGSVVQGIDVGGSNCRAPYRRARPCARRLGRELRFNTALVPNGVHVTRLLVADATGTATATRPFPLETFNGSPTPTRVHAEVFTSGHAATRIARVRHGRAASVIGTVTDPAGNRLAGARVIVTARLATEHDGGTQIADVLTDPTGVFRAPVTPGPSRVFFATFVGGDGNAVAYDVAKIEVAAPITLKVTPRRVRSGRKIRWSGTVALDLPWPRDDLDVRLETLKSGRWTQFGNAARTDAFGRFRGTYRFAGFGSFPLRAVVSEERSLPYAEGRSRIVRVRVRRG